MFLTRSIPTVLGSATVSLKSKDVSNTKSIAFDGSDYIQLGDLDVVTDNFTMCGWAKPTDASDWQVIMSKYDDNNTYIADRVFRIFLDGSICKCALVNNAGSGASLASSTTTTTLSDNTWFHFAFTNDGSNLKGYINGVLEDTDSTTGGTLNASNQDFLIGAQHDNTTISHYFAGNIDEIGIWNSALTAAEIKAIYDYTKTNSSLDLTKTSVGYQSSSNLKAWWRMGDGDTYPVIADRRKTFFTGSSINFDGTDNFAIIEDHADFTFGDGSSDSAFSVSAWINMDDATDFTILNKGVYNTDGEWNFRVNSSDKLIVALYDESVNSTHESLVSNSAITAYEGSWIHVAATYDGTGGTSANGGLALYLNGSALASSVADAGTYVAMENQASNVFIGRMDTNYANGKITDVAIWDAELSATDISEIYNSGEPTDLTVGGNYHTDKTSNLKGYWRLGLEGEGDTLPDWGGLVENNANVGLIMNQAQPITTWGSNIISFNYHNNDITASFISSSNNGSGGITGNGTEYIMEMIGGSYQYMRINERDVSGTALDITGKMLKITMSIKCDSDFLGSDFEIDAARSETTNTLLFKPTTSYTTITFYQLANQNYINSFTMRSEGIVYMKDIAIYIADGVGHCLPSNTNDEIDYEEHAPNRHSGTMTSMTSADIETEAPPN
tara:strand:- start:540 stop:2552 length:2013 start_codon:yes stop_codon:yes gene_type:complete